MTPRSIKSFATFCAAARQSLFGGNVDPKAKNLQIGATQFRAAFTQLLNVVEFRTHGKILRCTAVVLLPESLGLTVDETTLITHLPTGDIYEVAQIGIKHPVTAETRCLLRRQEE